MRTAFQSSLVISVLSLTLAGCGNNPYPEGDTAKPISYRTLAEDPKTLDPSVSYTVSESLIVDPIYPSYFQYDYLKRDPVVLQLNLGAKMPEREEYTYIAEDENGNKIESIGEIWTFRIKEGLRFQDDPCFEGGKGREIFASDIVYAFKRIADPATNCPVLGFFIDKVVGMPEYRAHNMALMEKGEPTDLSYPIEGIQVDPDDPYAFSIRVNQKYPQLKYMMAMHFTTPIAHEAVETYGKDLATHPVGCGPFLLKEYKRRQWIRLERNPNYREEYYPTEGTEEDKAAGLLEDAGKRLPILDAVHYNINRESVSRWNLFVQGYTDLSAVGSTNYQQVMSPTSGGLSDEMREKGIHLVEVAGTGISYYVFNMEDPVVGGYTEEKRKLRQAISKSIDNQSYIDVFLIGLGVPAQFCLPPQLEGYDPDYVNPYNTYDLEEAKKLLAEAGYPNGISEETGERLTIYYDDAALDPVGRQSASSLIQDIEELGIDVELRMSRPNIWQDKVREGKFQFVTYGWVADYPDPENFLFLYYGPNKRPGPNYSGYNNPEFDRLYEEMRAMDSGPERVRLIHKMRDILAKDCPWNYRLHSVSYGLYQPWLKNLKPHPLARDTIKYHSIDTEMRVRLQKEWNKPNYWPGIVGLILFIIAVVPAAQVVHRRRNRRVRRSGGGSTPNA